MSGSITNQPFLEEQNGVIHTAKGTTDRKSEGRKHRCSLCDKWSALCSRFIRLLQHLVGFLGENIAGHPVACMAICIFFVLFCAVGFLWLKTESRTEKLFIPQDSRAINDLNRAEKFFRLKVRVAGVILVAHAENPNILAPECLAEAQNVHSQIITLKSFTEFCLTLSGQKASFLNDCVTIDPFQIFQDRNFSNKSLIQIQAEINTAFNNTRLLMRDGQLFQRNFPQIFGDVTKQTSNRTITGARAMQLKYLIRDPPEDDVNKKVLEWEKTFLDKVASMSASCFEIYYEAERSTDDAIKENSSADITLVSITFTIMISFACFMLGKFVNPLTGHSMLANVGVLAVAFGILAGMGLGTWSRVTYVNMIGVVPFLVLSIGIDDMFIIVDELDRQPRDMGVIRTVKEVMSRTGATVTMTTMTDLVAFAVSTSTAFPAIRYFCTYAALAVTLSYAMMITFFVAAMTFDIRRIKSGRRDCLPVCTVPPTKDGQPHWDAPRPQTSNRLLKGWAKFLMLPETKFFVLVISVAILALGIYGTTKVTENFDRRMLAKDDSALLKFLNVREKYYEQTIPVSLVLTGNIDYSDPDVQDEIRQLSKIVKDNCYYRTQAVSWIEVFTNFSAASGMNITGPHFMPALKLFLESPECLSFKQDVKLSSNGSRVIASRVMAFLKNNPSSTFQKDAMLTIREDLAKKSPLDVIPITRPFIFFEQYAIIGRETTRNLIIAALAVLVVTSLFLVNFTVTLLVVVNFVALVLELFALMFIWDVSLNGVSMITLVMAIGFAVDYSAHIAHAFVMSEEDTPNRRVIDAVSTLGASVFMGGFSTFLGMLVLVFATSEIYRIFFRMFVGIVSFGLLHGLCILPVQLSLLCWKPVVTQRDPTHLLIRETDV
nr:patched domain-containing protein 3-like [Pocillopora verrucosa]